MATISPTRIRTTVPSRTRRRHGDRQRPSALATAILLLGAVYCLLPVLWVVIASTKSSCIAASSLAANTLSCLKAASSRKAVTLRLPSRVFALGALSTEGAGVAGAASMAGAGSVVGFLPIKVPRFMLVAPPGASLCRTVGLPASRHADRPTP